MHNENKPAQRNTYTANRVVPDAATHSERNMERNKTQRQIKFVERHMVCTDLNIFRLNDLYERGSI